MDHAKQRITIIISRLDPDTVVLTVAGDLDHATVPAFDQQVSAALHEQSASVVRLDLAAVQFCDLVGLRALHALGAPVRITAAHPQLDTLLRLCRISVLLGYRPPPE
ncbi:STAS domain-containing protein [Actinoplanes palleronii]|uniref:STAS domain-containing protein n=1 Tax=Actinoplanes palleronii TaxID=113570 RepID=A0ABQ4BA63_9ACTN|nr:STAS domain-containing protein [Actinoplanes palleronii]GIE67286.1 hypothetical protein Apa02nite_033940 [Actinoplanes palleronii]